MYPFNLNQGYGLGQGVALANGAGVIGKTFVVLDPLDPSYDALRQLLPPDTAGQNRIFSKIQDAIDTCVSGRNDQILVGPGSFVENLSSAGKDYVSIIGLSLSGYSKPDVVPTAGAAAITHSQGFVAKHIRFVGTGVGGIGVQQMGNGFLFEDCVFESTSNIGFRMFPDMDDDSYTASEGKVINCLIRDCAGGGMSFENPGPGVEGGVGVTDVVVSGCRFYGNTGPDIFDVYIGGNNQTYSRTLITECQFLTKNKATYIDLSAGSANDGMISKNHFAFTTAGGLTNGEIVLGNDIAFVGNYDAVGLVDGHTF